MPPSGNILIDLSLISLTELAVTCPSFVNITELLNRPAGLASLKLPKDAAGRHTMSFLSLINNSTGLK